MHGSQPPFVLAEQGSGWARKTCERFRWGLCGGAHPFPTSLPSFYPLQVAAAAAAAVAVAVAAADKEALVLAASAILGLQVLRRKVTALAGLAARVVLETSLTLLL